MKLVLKVYDFIKSWIYYPKMKRYLKEKCGVDCAYTRIQYALWHCKVGFLSDMNLKNSKIRISDIKNVWKNVYNIHPINK